MQLYSNTFPQSALQSAPRTRSKMIYSPLQSPPACQFGKKGDSLITLAAGAVFIVPLLAIWGILRAINPVPPSPEVGIVQPFVGPSYTVTADNQVSMFGIPKGSFDADGNAYDPFSNMVGYADEGGRLFKTETVNGVKTTVAVGSISEDGTVHGGRFNSGTQINLPGLSRKQKGAVAILSLL